LQNVTGHKKYVAKNPFTKMALLVVKKPLISQHSFRLPECPTLRGLQFSYFLDTFLHSVFILKYNLVMISNE